MTTIHTEIVVTPTAWTGKEMSQHEDWIWYFSAQDISEIDEALRSTQAYGLELGDIDSAAFPLPSLATRLAAHVKEVRTGRGFVLLRGLPLQGYSDEEIGKIFWGLGTHLGVPVAQNPRGDLLGHVYDQGQKFGAVEVRGYQTKAHLPFHSDSCDMVGLLCLRKAKSGGFSSIVSSVTLHNEVLKRRPDLLPVLYRGFHYIKREAALTESPVTPHLVPVFGALDGEVSCRIVPTQIEAAYKKLDQPLTQEERKALDLLAELSYDSDIHLNMDLQAGDIQLCNNYVVLHSRTNFEDWPEPERRRHMIRLWLTFDERRQLPQGFPALNGYRRNQLASLSLESASTGTT